jgi:hypothetical protein
MEIKDIKTVGDMVAALGKLDPARPLVLSVGWAADTAVTDEDEAVHLVDDGKKVVVNGWMSNCDTNLMFVGDEG